VTCLNKKIARATLRPAHEPNVRVGEVVTTAFMAQVAALALGLKPVSATAGCRVRQSSFITGERRTTPQSIRPWRRFCCSGFHENALAAFEPAL
jgi:hypothetical protein